LWRWVTDQWELDPHELSQLRQLVRAADTLEWLERELARAQRRVYSDGAQRVAAELRQQRLTYARLMAALRLPTGLPEDAGGGAGLPQRRTGVRGFYVVSGGA
jgi:hypothetical protein